MAVAVTNCRRDSFRDICSLPADLFARLCWFRPPSGLRRKSAQVSRLPQAAELIASSHYQGIQRSKLYWCKQCNSTAPLSQCRIALSSDRFQNRLGISGPDRGPNLHAGRRCLLADAAASLKISASGFSGMIKRILWNDQTEAPFVCFVNNDGENMKLATIALAFAFALSN